MASRKKDSNQKPIVKDDPERILHSTVEDVLHASMIPYAEHVIMERAIPRVEDGLKPVQRRVLYTMLELGTTPDKPHRKCARIVGDCLGKYHPHGDSSVYEALVRMAQDFVMRAPMVDGHGNFGSIDGDGAAAMRYTEARMTPLAMRMLKDIEKDTVPFRFNFDDTLKEPDMLPAYFPNLLVNGASGIAVGLATNIPTHNLRETVNACIAQIDDPDISLDELMKIIPGPDFPTGGIILKNDEIRRAYETGRGKLLVRAKVHIEEGSAGRSLLVITEIPYQVNKAAMLEKILKLTEEKKAALGCIYDIRDESDREGLRAVIELKKDSDPVRVLNYLYKYSDLQVTFGVNMVAIADGKPKTLGLKAMLGYFIQHQKNVVTRRTEYDLKQAEARAHILEGLMIAVDNLDEVIRIIRSSKNPKEARERLMEAFSLTEIQAQAILDMRLQRLTNLEVLALRKEYAELQSLISRYKGILSSEKKLMKVIRSELEAVAEEFGDERRTEITDVTNEPAEIADDTPAAEPAVVAFTNGGQMKRMAVAAWRRQPLPAFRDNPQESVRWLFETKTDETLLIFTDRGSCYPLAVSSLPEIKPQARGQLLTGLLQGLEDNEKPLLMVCLPLTALAAQPDFVFMTENGTVKRVAAADFGARVKKMPFVSLKKEDKVAAAFVAETRDDILAVTAGGMSIRFPLDSVPTQGRTAAGVKGMAVDEEDRIRWAWQLASEQEIVLISDRGCAKRIPALDFETQNRGGKGMKCFYFNKNASNGRLLAGGVRTAAPCTLRITQASSAPTDVDRESLAIQAKTGRGTPCVMSVLEDVVTGMTVLDE